MHPHTTTFAVELTAGAPREGVADGAKLCSVGKVEERKFDNFPVKNTQLFL